MKLIISVNQAQKVDEKNGITSLFSMCRFQDIGILKEQKSD